MGLHQSLSKCRSDFMTARAAPSAVCAINDTTAFFAQRRGCSIVLEEGLLEWLPKPQT